MVIDYDQALELAKLLKQRVVQSGIPVQRALLFGSFARQQNRTDSDIDVALVSDSFSGNRFQDVSALIPVLMTLSSQLEVHPFTAHGFTTEQSSMVGEILKEGIEI